MRANGTKARPPIADSTKPNQTRLEILDAASDIIVRQGYEACTMRSIAAIVGMKAGSIYYHFKSKDEIIEEILNRGIEKLFDFVSETIREVPEDATFSTRVEAAVRAHLSSLLGPEQKHMGVYEHLPPGIKRRSRRMRQRYARLWIDLFAGGVAAGDVDPAADLGLLASYFLGGLNRVPEWIRASGADHQSIAELATRTLLLGIGTHRAAGTS